MGITKEEQDWLNIQKFLVDMLKYVAQHISNVDICPECGDTKKEYIIRDGKVFEKFTCCDEEQML